jgi:hypothetical protein
MVQAMPQEVLEKRIIPQIPAGRLGTPEEIRAAWSSPPTTPVSSRARRSRRMAGSIWCEVTAYFHKLGNPVSVLLVQFKTSAFTPVFDGLCPAVRITKERIKNA